MKKTGLVGGTFDPIHNGHLLLGEWAQKSFSLDEIWFLPAGNPYFKVERKIASQKDRLSMTELAVSDRPSWKVCDAEIGLERNTYTYETVERLNQDFPEREFYFIFGSDCLESLEYWRYPEKILAGCRIIASVRSKDSQTEEGLARMAQKAEKLTEKFGGEILIMNFPAPDISSTMIRNRVTEKKSIHGLVPEKVEAYILVRKLYL